MRTNSLLSSFIIVILMSLVCLFLYSMMLHGGSNNHWSPTTLYRNYIRQNNAKTLYTDKNNRSAVSNIFVGRWIKKANVSIQTREHIYDMQKKYREAKGLLFSSTVREDGKCGTRYKINTSFQAQCNASSEKPCCNERLGECGNNETYCNCGPYCTDYSNIIMPEFYDWIETYDPITTFNSTNTCTFLTEKFSSIAFIGDSFIRHFWEAFLIHLTDDPIYGALKYNLNVTLKSECAEYEQFHESICRFRVAKSFEEVNENPNFCKNVKHVLKFDYHIATKIADIDKIRKMINQIMERSEKDKIALFVIGIGIHDNFQEEETWIKFLQPVIRTISSNKNVRLIWSSSYPSGILKRVKGYKKQGSASVLRFNQAIKKYLKPYNIPIVENFNLAFGVYSFDGTHYGQALNMVKVRLFIKLLRLLF